MGSMGRLPDAEGRLVGSGQSSLQDPEEAFAAAVKRDTAHREITSAAVAFWPGERSS